MLNILFQPQQQPPKKEEERGDGIFITWSDIILCLLLFTSH